MENCSCGKPSMVGVGPAATPVCMEHYEQYLTEQFKPMVDLNIPIISRTVRLNLDN